MSESWWGRVVVFVNGFNVYFSFALRKGGGKLKWLDFRRLCSLIVPKSADLRQVLYFTAYDPRAPDKVARHKRYVRALESVAVLPVFGRYKKRSRRCPKCKQGYLGYEEKQADVNIASRLLVAAAQDRFDTALLVTGDSDLLPAIRAVKEHFPDKRIGVCFPPRRRTHELQEVADFVMRLKDSHLEAAQFPDTVSLADGTTLKRPAKWS